MQGQAAINLGGRERYRGSAEGFDDPVRTTTKDGGPSPWATHRPTLTHGRPYRDFGRFPLVRTGEHAKRISESRQGECGLFGYHPIRGPRRMGRRFGRLDD
jgi:hypothetical protein